MQKSSELERATDLQTKKLTELTCYLSNLGLSRYKPINLIVNGIVRSQYGGSTKPYKRCKIKHRERERVLRVFQSSNNLDN
jgi:hypothetical protein